MTFAVGQKGNLMNDLINRQEAIDLVHKTIYSFFDDGSEMSINDKLLLQVNKAICNGIKELTPRESAPRRTMADIQDEIEATCGHMIRLRLCYRGEEDEVR